jgi:FtsZ-interacting cell division protein ZipA
MSTVLVLAIIILVLVIAGLVAGGIWGARRRRSAKLRERFGPEFTREVRARGSEREAEQHLSQVADRRDRLDIRPLEPTARQQYTGRWEAVQAEFVDQPGPALDKADQLVTEVMRERGYPTQDFTAQAQLVAADHPQVVEHYRAARAVRHAHHGSSGATPTEDLRRAFVHYRALFDELVTHGR